jgi:ribosome-binding factor A
MAPSQRQLRVGEQIRHILAGSLLRGELHDPRLEGVSVTIGEVRMSRDLRQAQVFATELGGHLQPETLAALEHAAPRLAGQVARAINLKYAPRIRFVADELFDEAARMERLLSEAMATVRPAEEENEDGTGRT